MKIKIRVFLKGGAVLPDFVCDGFDVEYSRITGEVTAYHMKGCQGPKPLYIGVGDILAVVNMGPADEAQCDCNDCGKAKTCEYVPKWGGFVRINCPLWRAKG